MIKKFLVFFCLFLTLSNFAWAITPENEQDLGEKLPVQNEKLQILDKKTKQLSSSVSSLKDSLKKTNDALAEQNTAIGSQADQINAYKQLIENNKTAVDKLFLDIGILNSIADDFNITLEEITNGLSSQKTKTADQADQISEIDQQVRENKTATETLSIEIKTFNGIMADFKKALKKLNTDLSNQKIKIDGHENQISAVENGVEKNRGMFKIEALNIKKNESAIKGLYTDTQQLNSITANINKNLDNLKVKISGLDKKTVELKEHISESLRQVSSNMNTVQQKAVQQKKDLNQSISQRTLIFTLGFIVILVLIVSIYIMAGKKLLSSTDAIDKKITGTREKLEADSLKTDTILTDLIEKQLKIVKQPAPSAPDQDEPDHSLAVRVGQEIHRMRKRISHMSEGTKGLGALKNSLNRLEEQFNDNGYELIDLMGKPFVDGLSVKARFIPSDELNPGEEIITKIIKPQINFNGILIQAADVEVSTGD